MKPKSSIIRLSIIGVAIILGFVLAFCPFQIGNTKYLGFANTVKQGLDLKGGVYAVYEAEEKPKDNFDTAMSDTIRSLKKHLEGKGYAEPVLQRKGERGLSVTISDNGDADVAKALLKALGSPSEVEFIIGTLEEAQTGTGEVVLLGTDHVKSAKAMASGGYVVELTFTSEGRELFKQATTQHMNETMHVVTVNVKTGERKVEYSPNISGTIDSDKAYISGMASMEAAEELAQKISSGKFSLILNYVDMFATESPLGDNTALLCIIAGAIALVLIIAGLFYLYGLFGAASGISLLCFVAALLFIISVFPWMQITFGGIAGILLSIGLTIAGNIIINERVKDEYSAGKSVLSASHYGFRKSIRVIMDGNLITAIAGLMLLLLGSGAVSGFAATLLIGTVLSTASTLLLTPRLMKHMVRINDYNPKLFKLTRGKDFEHLDADQNDAKTEIELKEEARKKEARRKKEEAPEGGNV